MNIQRIAGYAFFSAALGCHPAARAFNTPYIVTFQGGWTRVEPGPETDILSVPLAFDVRLSNSPAEWLLRVKSIEGKFSDQCYTVRGGSSPAARRATVAEWERAPLTESTVVVAAHGAATGVQGILYQNRQYAMAGRVFGKALLSRSRTWLAIISETPDNQPARSNPLLPLGGGEPTKGEIFLDVYDTRTGTRTATAQAPFSGFGAGILFDQAFWVQDNAFIMPLTLLADRCFFFAPAQ